MPETLEARPGVAWMAVLDRLETTLDRSLELSAEPAAAIAQPVDRSALRRLDERLAALQAALDRAEANAAEADARLAEEAERAQQCVEALQASRQRILEITARSA